MIEYLRVLELRNTLLNAAPWVIASILVPWLIYVLGVRASRRIAEESGAFKKPGLFAGIHGTAILNGATMDIVIGMPKKKEVGVAYELLITVGNHGDRDLENVVVRVKHAPKSPTFLPNEGSSLVHSFIDDEVARKEVETDDERTHITRLHRITPKARVDLPELVVLHDSLHEVKDMDVVTSDGVKAKISFNMTLATLAEVNVSSSNESPMLFFLSILCYRAENIDQLMEDFIKYLKNKRSRDGTKTTSGKQYLFIMPKYVEQQVDGGRVVLTGQAEDGDRLLATIVEHGKDVFALNEKGDHVKSD